MLKSPKPAITLDSLVEMSGSKSRYDLAKRLGVSQNCVFQWFHRGRISAAGAIKIAALTHGKLKADDLVAIGR